MVNQVTVNISEIVQNIIVTFHVYACLPLPE